MTPIVLISSIGLVVVLGLICAAMSRMAKQLRDDDAGERTPPARGKDVPPWSDHWL